jgi:hypothetical protein
MSLHDLVLLLHILGAGVVIGVVFFSLVLAFKKPLDPSWLGVLKFIRRFGTMAVGWEVLTGLYLAFSESDEVFSSKIFWIKMGLIVVDGFLAQAVIGRKLSEAQSGVDAKGLKLATLVSALVILLVVTLGFLIANSD